MMRRLLLAVAWAAVLALSVSMARAQDDDIPRNFDAVMEAVGEALQSGDSEAPFVVLNRAIRTARAEGRLTPDWSIFFAMAADFIRNDRGNPAFALALTEEGLALIAGDPSQDDFAAALRVSGAYALADLGRMDEAVARARLALPLFRDTFGEDAAEELEGYVALWAEGQLSAFNTSALELARDALERARSQADEGAHGMAISLAGAALLPPGGNLDAGTLRAVNAEAEVIIADSLRALGRTQDAANAYLRAISHLAQAPWQPGADAVWWPEADEPEGADLLANAFHRLAGLAISAGASDLAIAALEQSQPFSRSTDAQITGMLYQAVLAGRDGDTDRALAIIAQSRARALDEGETATVIMADFYAAQVSLFAALLKDSHADPSALIAAGEAALAHGQATGNLDETAILGDMARHLSRTDDTRAALDYARRSLIRRRALLAGGAGQDSGFGRQEARRAQRGALETFLRTAHDAAAQADPECEDPSRFAYYGCVIATPRH
ncbi:hypothetical protein [Oceaniglobus trochenteri]|uniref:hypothetical protein n=1 Tax=Oceaniglobus trochenteri TaxID=2763260 RepID=UPI001CFFFF7D|nr:hypothetical protein [Oceaniglobus trochenteri]